MAVHGPDGGVKDNLNTSVHHTWPVHQHCNLSMPTQSINTREGGEIGLFITLIPNVFKFIGLTALGTLSNFDYKLSVNTIQLLIVTYRWGNSVYNRWGCTLYNSLSTIFVSL